MFLNLLELSGPVQACNGSAVVFKAKITDVVEIMLNNAVLKAG
jgi:hypothetical protein